MAWVREASGPVWWVRDPLLAYVVSSGRVVGITFCACTTKYLTGTKTLAQAAYTDELLCSKQTPYSSLCALESVNWKRAIKQHGHTPVTGSFLTLL
jgi:hypothetical protein